MFLRVGLLVLGIILFVFLGWAAISSWVTVFSEGASEVVDSNRIGGQSAETPALAAAITATAFALLSALAAVVAGVDLARRRRRGLDGVDA